MPDSQTVFSKVGTTVRFRINVLSITDQATHLAASERKYIHINFKCNYSVLTIRTILLHTQYNLLKWINYSLLSTIPTEDFTRQIWEVIFANKVRL